MPTERITIDAHHPDRSIIDRAAGVLRDGGLVAFPTETVYGLAANALDGEAVRRIFAAKGRPATNPVIVHVTCPAEARNLTVAWPAAAERLAERFWPGPLTLVLPKHDTVPDVTTAGGTTVAVRVPSHPVARALIASAGVPLAAPSANSSTRISATTADHVYKMLAGRIEMILDGGPTPGGLESTVVNLSRDAPRLLRPGLIDVAQLEALLGETFQRVTHGDVRRAMPSPGLMDRHYAPTAPLECIERGMRWPSLNPVEKVGAITFGPSRTVVADCTIEMPTDVSGYSAQLYEALHRMEAVEVDRIMLELPPDEPEWLAVRDRLRRASWQG